MRDLASIILGIILASLGVLVGLSFYSNAFSSDFKDKEIFDNVPLVEKSKEEDITTKIAFVGDIMLDRGVKGMVNKYFEGDYSQIFKNAGILKDYDILFGNLEGPVSDTGNKVGSIYSFRMDPVVIPVLKDAGFDIVSFANNHVGDWNKAAFKDTITRLSDGGILQTGGGFDYNQAKEVKIIEKNGIKFGFVAFSDVGPDWIKADSNNAGLLLASDPNLENIIKDAKTKSDILFVSFHWGEEYKTIHNSRQEYLAHKAIDAGADAVIGHHPHVAQDFGYYKDKPIFYSLGNFVFDQYFSKETMQGLFVEFVFDGKDLVHLGQKNVYLNNKYQIDSIK